MIEVLLPIALFLMMTSMGMSLVVNDFREVIEHPKAALVGLGSMLLVVPLLGFVVASWSSLPPALAVGVVLVATCPGGMFSNLYTDMGRGNLALSVSLTAIVSMVYVFTIPLWSGHALRTFGSASADVGVPFAQTLMPLLSIVILPILSGMVIRVRWQAFAERWTGLLKSVAALLVIVIFVALSVVQSDTLLDNAKRVFLPVLVLNLSSVGIAAAFAVLARLERRDAIAVIVEHAIRQEGTAIFLAVSVVGSPEMALPLMINASIGGTIGLLFLLAFGGKRPLVTRLRGTTTSGI